MDSFIRFEKVSKKFGKNQVLQDLDLSVEKGDICGIIGLSGSGKTTILNLLIGFLRYNSGKIIFQDKDIRKDKNKILKQFGFATQVGSFYNRLSVRENLAFFGRLYQIPKKELNKRINELLTLVELKGAEHLLANQLSTGMRRRLDIACALITYPNVLIMDEPTEDLDPFLRKETLGLIKKINLERGTTILITSHLLGEMEEICTNIAVLHNGHIISHGSPDMLRETYTRNEEIHFSTTPGNYETILANLDRSDVSHIISQPHKVVVYTPNAETVLHNVVNAIQASREKLVNLDVNKPTLEEVFEALTKR